MLHSLLITALLMGLGGLVHCGAMCAAPCAVALPGGVPPVALLGRTLGYAGLGALAAGAMGLLSAWARWAVALQPLWVMLLAATAVLGGWMAVRGAMPSTVQDHGLRGYRRLQAWVDASALLDRRPGLKTLLPLALGMAWAALPCGLLYGAVTIAALAGSPAGGALVMMAFSLPGALVLWWLPRRLATWPGQGAGVLPRDRAGGPTVAPILWRPRLQAASAAPAWGMAQTPSAPLRSPWSAAAPPRLLARWPWLLDPRWAVRLSGIVLCLASGWALAQRLQAQWLAWCV